jgi:hypothetical protein
MSIVASTASDPDPVIFPVVLAELPARPRAEFSQSGVWRRVSFWSLEFLRLVAVVYALPLAILAIGIPVGLALTGLFLRAT